MRRAGARSPLSVSSDSSRSSVARAGAFDGDTGSYRFRSSTARATFGPPVVPPSPSRVDLHTHSRRSDGVLEPAELVAQAAAVGVRVLALADHDTLAGVRELMAPDAADLPLDLLPAVEINSIATGMGDLWEGELHILGIGMSIDDEAFEDALIRQRDFRAARFARIVARLAALGLPVDQQVERFMADSCLTPGASLGRPQIARTLVDAGHAMSVDDAMKRLLARGRPAYVAREGLGPVEAIRAINAAGGIASLAHFADAAVRRDLLVELKDAGLRGLEVHYRHFDAPTVAELESVAASLGFLRTGGSDYHGDGETYAQVHARLYVPETAADALNEALGRTPRPESGAR
jgi:predicted metal-dependent phosphoesterase TrpH